MYSMRIDALPTPDISAMMRLPAVVLVSKTMAQKDRLKAYIFLV